MELITNYTNGSLEMTKHQWPRTETCSKETINNWKILRQNSSLIYEPFPYQSETQALTTTWIVIGVLGIIENSFIIYVTRARITFRGPITDKAGQRKALVYYFIYNLGYSDIMTSVASIILVVQFHFEVFLEAWSCRLIRFIGFLFTTITMEILLVISVERYYAVVHPYRSFDIVTSRSLVRGAWCVGFLLTVVATVTYDVKRVCVTSVVYTMACIPANTPVANTLSLLFVLLIYLIPGVIITVSTLSTICKIKSTNTVNILPNAAEHLQKIRATRILSSVIFFFIVPYLGLVVYTIALKYEKLKKLGHKTIHILGYATAIICFSNCVINPILLVCHMKSLQQKLKGFLKFRAERFPESSQGAADPGVTRSATVHPPFPQ